MNGSLKGAPTTTTSSSNRTRLSEYDHSMDSNLHAGLLLMLGFLAPGIVGLGMERPSGALADGIASVGCIIWGHDTSTSQALGFT